MEFAPEALGKVVRERRSAKGLTQAALGDAAGYRAGAGVAISRIEHGLTRPRQARFESLALALDLTAEQLTAAAEERTREMAEGRDGADGVAGPAAGRRRSEGRPKRVHQEVARRKQASRQLCKDFNDAHDRACDAFLLPFVELTKGIAGAPPGPAELEDDLGEDPRAEAKMQLRFTSIGVAQALAVGKPGPVARLAAKAVGPAVGPAAGRAAAYGAFRLAVFRGIAGTGVRVSELHGAPQMSAARAVVGGGTLLNGGKGQAGGLRRLKNVGLGVEVVTELSVAMAAVAYDFNKQRLEVAAKLDAELAATHRGFEAFEDLIPRATKVLDDIAVHGGRALGKWGAQLGPSSQPPDALDPAQRKRYDDLVELAACQLAVAWIDFDELVETRGADRGRHIELADQVLSEAQAVVDSLV